MAEKKYVVRIVTTQPVGDGGLLTFDAIPDSFLECLRYAGLITVHSVDENSLIYQCFDLHCPHGLRSKVWAEMNAERMQTFGYNAVAAPAVSEPETTKFSQ